MGCAGGLGALHPPRAMLLILLAEDQTLAELLRNRHIFQRNFHAGIMLRIQLILVRNWEMSRSARHADAHTRTIRWRVGQLPRI